MEPKDALGEHCERAMRAAEQLRDVIARDVLHHQAAGLGDLAIGADEAGTEDQVPHAAVAVAKRSRQRGRDDATNARAGDDLVDRESLACLGELGLQVVEAN